MGPRGRSAPGHTTLQGLRTLPFVLAGVFGVALSLTASTSAAWALGVLAATLVVGALAVVLPWRSLPDWGPLALSCAVLVVIGLLLVAVGTGSPGSWTLVLLPVLWLAMFGTRWQLVIVLAWVPFVVAVPLLYDGESLGTAVRAAVVVTSVATAVGVPTQNLVRQIQDGRRASHAAQRRQRTILDTVAETAIVTWSPDRVVTQMNSGAERLFGVAEADAAGRLSPADVIGGEAMEALDRELGFANPADPDAAADELIIGSRWSSEPRGVVGVTVRLGSAVRPTWVQMDLAAVVDDNGAATEYVLVAHDVTALQQARLDLQEAQRDLAAVVDVLHETQAGHDVRSTVCTRTRELTDADVVAVFEPVDGELAVTAYDGIDIGDLRLPLDADSSAAGRAFFGARRVTVADTATHPGVARAAAEWAGVRAVLYEPVRHDGQVVAVLGLGWRQPGRSVTERVGDSVWALAAEAGMAMRRERHLRTLETHAALDGLTGLPNRRTWDRTLASAVGHAGPDADLCLAMLDLDHFKAYNDTHGHQAGDALLRDAGRAWRSQLRGSDVLARYGGEEFALLLPACPLATATGVLDRLRRATPPGCTVSVGMARWDGQESATQLLGRADAALYRAKESGRDRVVVDDSSGG